MARLTICAMCTVCLLVDISGGGYRVEEPVLPPPVVAMQTEEQTTAYVEPETTITETAPQSVEQTTESVSSDYSRGFVHYAIAGNVPPYEWEWYLYCQLVDRGVEWFYPYAICQIWQESRWNPQSTNGVDHGLCQFKGIYWDGWARDAGIPGADIWDAYAQMHVYAWMMSGYIRASGWDVEMALSMYFLGRMEYSAMYVGYVTGWLNSLEVVD